jgi:hypothetical protein
MNYIEFCSIFKKIKQRKEVEKRVRIIAKKQKYKPLYFNIYMRKNNIHHDPEARPVRPKFHWTEVEGVRRRIDIRKYFEKIIDNAETKDLKDKHRKDYESLLDSHVDSYLRDKRIKSNQQEMYDHQKKEYAKWLCKQKLKGNDRYYSNMRFVSQCELDEWKSYKQESCKRKLGFYETFPDVFIARPFSQSYDSFKIWEPGYLRVEKRNKPEDKWTTHASREGIATNEKSAIYKHFMFDYKQSNRLQAKTHINNRNTEQENRYHKMLKYLDYQNKIDEQIKNARKVTVDEDTTSFFQALAVGSVINN